MLRSLLLSLGLIIPPAISAADPLAETLLRPLALSGKAPGGALSYRADDETGGAAFGLRAHGKPATVQPDDPFHIGSNTKAITATLIARLVAQGRLSWDDTIGARLGPLMPMDGSHAATTFRDLVNHTSGLPANGPLTLQSDLRGPSEGRDLIADRLTYAAKTLAKPAKGKGKFRYSNAGYVIAGAMIEAATGEAWEALVRREVFAPLGITGAGFGPPGTGDQNDAPEGHRTGLRAGGGIKPMGHGIAADNPPALGPAGTAHMSADSLLRFLVAHMHEDPSFLPPEQWAILHSPAQGADYVAGWAVMERGGTRLYLHNGSNTLWFALMGFSPEQNRAIVLMANAGRGEREMVHAALPFLSGEHP